jgi:hypothetical protein
MNTVHLLCTQFKNYGNYSTQTENEGGHSQQYIG